MRSRSRVRILIGISALMLAGPACDGPIEPTSLTAFAITPDSALVYQSTKVVIRGARFDRPTVRLGGKYARVTASDATRIWVETPLSDPGVVDVVVTNFLGEEVRMAKAFTFQDFGPTAMYAEWGVFTAHPITIIGAGFLPGARVLFDGVEIAVLSTRASEIVVALPARISGIVDVSVINPDGRTATLSRGFSYGTITLSTNTTSVSPGGPLEILWDGPRWFCECGVYDRIGLFRIGDPNDRAVWETPIGITNWSQTLAAPAVPGQYEFRYFVSDSPDIFRSPVIVVGPPAPSTAGIWRASRTIWSIR